MSTPASHDVGSAPAEGLITDKAVADARAMIGLQLRPEGPYLQDATADTLRNWCNGIGDLNPLYRDAGYGAGTRYGCWNHQRDDSGCGSQVVLADH